MAKDKRIEIRVPDEVKKAWIKKAKLAKLSLADLIYHSVEAYSGNPLLTEAGTHFEPPEDKPEVTTSPAPEATPEGPVKNPSKSKSKYCTNPRCSRIGHCTHGLML